MQRWGLPALGAAAHVLAAACALRCAPCAGRGLYATHDAGATWQPCSPGTWAGLYPVGLAFNPARPGEALVTAGDRPPGTGVHVFWTRDGGGAWRDITETVFGGSLAEVRAALLCACGQRACG